MGRPRTYEREEVLTRAMELFWRKGFEGTHLQELVEVTGLNRYSLYEEFNGKRGIFSEALEKYLAYAREFYEPLFAKPLGVKNIFDYFESIEFVKGYHGCFAINTLTEQHIIDMREFKEVKSFFRAIERAYFDNLCSSYDRGEISKHVEPKSLSKLLMSLDIGLSVYGILGCKNSDKNLITSLLHKLV